MGKSIFTMSAAQRLKAQERQSRRFDRAVNKKFKAMKKAWKKKIAGKAVFRQAKEIIRTKSGDSLREMASKVKVKFEEKMSSVKGAAEAGAMAGMNAADGVREAQEVNNCSPLEDATDCI